MYSYNLRKGGFENERAVQRHSTLSRSILKFPSRQKNARKPKHRGDSWPTTIPIYTRTKWIREENFYALVPNTTPSS